MVLRILYEDSQLLAVDKPAGLLSVPGRGPEKADCVVSRASEEYGWIREAHRLDQATSGILLLARNAEAHRNLSAAFADRLTYKTYVALTVRLPADPGIPGVEFRDFSDEPGLIVVHQRLDPENRPRQVVDLLRGKRAVTGWKSLGTVRDSFCRLELSPLTGRTHQLRLALAVCGAFIPGDCLYAPEDLQEAMPRLMLHATGLRFPHPSTGEEVEICSDPEF